MTTPGAQATTLPFAITPGAAPAAITDGGNSPVGMALVNRGDHGATVWVQAGPAGGAGAVPIGPGGSITWTDPITVPYAYLAPGATAAETLLVTNQSADYSNPVAVAAATATQLLTQGIPAQIASQINAQGVPAVYTDTGVGTYLLQPMGSGNPTPSLQAVAQVGAFASVLVSVQWAQPTPVGNNLVTVDFDDPAVPQMPYVRYYLSAPNGANNGSDAGTQFSWMVPVAGPRMTLTNRQTPDNNNSPALINVAGTNRVADRFRQLGDELGAHVVQGSTNSVTGTSAVPLAGVSGGGMFTRMNGPILVIVKHSTSVAGSLLMNYVNPAGSLTSVPFALAADGTLNLTHPAVPVFWSFAPNSSAATNIVTATVLAAT